MNRPFFCIFASYTALRFVLESFIKPRTGFRPEGARKDRGILSLAILTAAHIFSNFVVCRILFLDPSAVTAFRFIPGTAFCAAGFAGRIAALRALGKAYSLFMVPAEGSGLVTHGIYSKIRHPIYAFYLLEMAGFFIIFPGLETFVSFFAVCSATVYRVEKEEALLERFYGDAFRIYKKSTKKLVFFIY